jgi:hypothetical protein
MAVMMVPVWDMVMENPTEEGRGDVAALQGLDTRLIRMRCGTVSHGLSRV